MRVSHRWAQDSYVNGLKSHLFQEKRLKHVFNKTEWLIQNFMQRQQLRDSFSNIYDLQRLIARCAMNSANAVDCQR